MSRVIIAFSLLFMLLAMMPSSSAKASTLAVNLDLTDATVNTSSGAGMGGWEFSLSAPISVEGLAYWDADGDGLMTSHEIGIWQLDGILITSATVTAGESTPILSGFRITDIAPTNLGPGTYRIAAFNPNSGGHNDPLITTAPHSTFPSPISWDARVFSAFESSFQFPTNTNTIAPSGNFGVAFTYSVPEPSSLGFLAIGGLTLLRRRCA